MKALVLAAATALGVWATAALAQDDGTAGTPMGGVDVDGDGVADCGTGVRHGFVDVDGDGINDLAQDADGDGVPNAADPDYAGFLGRGHHGRGLGHMGFVDEDGDGINDLAQDADGDGTPNGMDPDYVLPAGVTRRGHHGRGGMMGRGQAPTTPADGGTASAALVQARTAVAGAAQASGRQMGGMGVRARRVRR
ncbi:MAG: hypothetical protein AB1505_00295 [Candidatus Latescibacterota bacterium]